MRAVSKKMQLLAIATAVLLLAGCATSQLKVVANPTATWAIQQHAMAQVTQWQMQGLLGVKLEKQAFSANFNWQQAAQSYVINLYGPLGIGATELDGDAKQVTLKLHDGRVLSADNTRDLMQENLGWSLPVAGLSYWVRGIPIPNVPVSLSLNAYGLAAVIEQQGWTISYLAYQVQGNKPIPRKIRLQNQSLSLMMIINDWRQKK